MNLHCHSITLIGRIWGNESDERNLGFYEITVIKADKEAET